MLKLNHDDMTFVNPNYYLMEDDIDVNPLENVCSRLDIVVLCEHWGGSYLLKYTKKFYALHRNDIMDRARKIAHEMAKKVPQATTYRISYAGGYEGSLLEEGDVNGWKRRGE